MMLATSAMTPLNTPVTRRSVGKVPTILVFTDVQDDFNKIAGTFAAADSLCSLFPVDSLGTFRQALGQDHVFDAVIVALDLGDCDPTEALALAAAACPGAAQFVLSGRLAQDELPRRMQQCGADAIPDDDLFALPYVIDSIMRERGVAKLMQQALNEHEQLFSLLTAHIDDALWVCNSRADRILYLSPAFSRIWGLDVEELYADAQNWLKHIHPNDVDRYVQEFTDNAMSARAFAMEYRIQRPDGEIRTIRDKVYPITNDEGKLYRFGGIMHDITDELRVLEDARLSQRLEAVGQLAAGIAHEINTPAQFIGDNLRFVNDGLASLLEVLERLTPLARGDAPADAGQVDAWCDEADLEFLRTDLPLAIEQSLDGIERVATIVRAMKEFSHPGSALPEPANLNETVRSAITVSRNEWKYVADLDYALDPDLPLVVCHRQAVSQVLVNLIVNAAHAVAEKRGGTGQGHITVSTAMRNGWITVAITDDGTGMSPAVKARIFDQFFTTKEVGRGTGQGLAMAWRTIVDGHGGRIEVETEEGKGSTFTLQLPVDGPHPGQTAAGSRTRAADAEVST